MGLPGTARYIVVITFKCPEHFDIRQTFGPGDAGCGNFYNTSLSTEISHRSPM
jgi:hypothetical protein